MAKIIVLGAGISGLSAGWFLKNKIKKNLDLTILEKSNRAGGLIKTIQNENFLFETGPRSCRTHAHAEAFLELIEGLALQDQVIAPSDAAKDRFIYKNKKLEKLPDNFLSFLFSSLTKNGFKHALKDVCGFSKPPSYDESVYQFMMRKVGVEITENLFAPLVSGIYAGDIHKLSLKACFPILYQIENDYGSLIRGSFFQKKKEIKNSFFLNLHKPSLISFKKGMQTVSDALAYHLQDNLFLNKNAVKIEILKNGVKVHLEEGVVLEGDVLISSLAAHQLHSLLDPSILKDLLLPFKSTSIASVSLGFKESVLKEKGFGYLIPPSEKEKILGVVFDSSFFKEQNKKVNETRLTVMIGGAHFKDFNNYTVSDFTNLALEALSNHLGIKEKPCSSHVEIAKNAIPQYFIGHKDQYFNLLHALPSHIKIIGSSFSGVSVNDCITNSRLMAETLSIAKKS